MNQSGGDMSSNHSLSIVLIDDSNIVLAQREAMIAEIDDVEVVATANDGAGAVRVVRAQRAERVAAQREAKVFIGEALVDEKGAIGEGCLPTLFHQFRVDQAPFALDQRRLVAERNDNLAALERADVEPRPGPPRHDCQPEDGIVFQLADIADAYPDLPRLTPCSATAA